MDHGGRQLQSICSPIIFLFPALSCLVEASYTEDNYGVVQMSLSNIITAILSLQEVWWQLLTTEFFNKSGFPFYSHHPLKGSLANSVHQDKMPQIRVLTVWIKYGHVRKKIKLEWQIQHHPLNDWHPLKHIQFASMRHKWDKQMSKTIRCCTLGVFLVCN